MKKQILLVAVIAILGSMPSHIGGAQDQAAAPAMKKMDLPLKLFVRSPLMGKGLLGKSLSVSAGVERADIIIKSSDTGTTTDAIKASGGTVRTIIGDIMTAFVPTAFLQALAARPEVKGLEAAKRMRPLMDSARANTGVDALQAGTSDGTSYDGRNVVVGIIDSGLDFSRADFNNSDGNSRVQYLGFQSIQSDSSISLTECVKSQIADGSCTIAATNDSSEGHGTHVAGIAAGSDPTYKGVAPAADIMFFRNTAFDDVNEGSSGTFSTSLLDGVTKIFTKADTIDKPCVINISQGTHIGAHDNTSLMEQGMNNAVEGKYSSTGKAFGRAIVAAAGNENVVTDLVPASIKSVVGGIHSSFSVTAGQSKAVRLWALRVSNSTPSENDQNRTPLIIDVWFGSDQSDICSIAGKVYGYSSGSFAATATGNAAASVGDFVISSDTDETGSSSSDKKVAVAIATDSSDSQNGKPRAIVEYGPGTSGTWDDVVTDLSTGYFLDIIIRASGGTCSGDMWLEGALGATYTHFLKGLDTRVTVTGTGSYTMLAGDSSKTVGLPASASGVVAVGAYLQEKPFGNGTSKWTDIDGTIHDATNANATDATEAQINGGTVGSRSPFSSIGPVAYTYSGRKPDLLAPGDPIISVLASGYRDSAGLPNAVVVNDAHYKLQGTSQSSPHVAGIIALLYQKNNTLTAAQAKQALVSTASKASSPDDSDGYGKVSATAAMASIGANQSGYSGTGDLGPSSSGTSTTSKGCGGTIAPVSAASSSAALIMLVIPGIIIGVLKSIGRPTEHTSQSTPPLTILP